METLKEKTAKGLFWGGMNNFTMQFIGLIFGIILGRLLTPSEYGMMAVISVFPLIAAALQDSGFTIALANMKAPEHKDYNAVFWFNLIVGVSAYVVLFFCAPLIAAYNHNDALIPLCRYAFLSLIVVGFSTAQSAYLFKHLRVDQKAKSSMTAVLTSSIVGVVMAWLGCSYWSLATQGIVYVTVNTLFLWHYSPWHPTWEFDFSPIRRMFGFSYKILATTITTHINNNILNVLLGHYFSQREAGYYNQAYQWDFKGFSLIQGMINQVAQPVLVDLREETGRQLNAFRKMMRFTAFISFPLMFGLSLVAREFIVLALTDRWLASARLLQVLCLGGSVMPLCTLMSNLIISKGKSDIFLGVTLALGIVQILLMVGLWPYGVRTMVVVYTVVNVVWLFVWHHFTRRLSGYRLRWLLADVMPFALSAAAVMGLTYVTTEGISNLLLLLVSRILMAAVLYYIAMKTAHVKILDECVNFIRDKIRRRK